MNNRSHIVRKILSAVALVVVLVVVAGWIRHRQTYPYGPSRSRIDQMMGALEMYARKNDGRYPAGGATPEASLSFLLRSNDVDVDTLRGMIISEKAVRRRLDAGQPLDADSCGWQYTEGLTEADDPDIAILYCKQALGDNGERRKDGGRQVVFVGGRIDLVSGEDWPAFLAKQKEFLSKRTEREKAGRPVVDAIIELPDGTRIKSANGPYALRRQEKDINGYTDDKTESGGALNIYDLLWFRVPVRIDFTGSVTRTLSFSNMVSGPVTVNFLLGGPDQTNVIFKMKKKE